MTARQFQKKTEGFRTEYELQKALVAWLRTTQKQVVKDRFFAVPNAARRSPKTAGMMQAQGMKAGVPDLVFYAPGGRVLWLELKNGKLGKPSESQVKMHADLYHCGHTVCMAHTIEEAKAAIINFYEN